jgi:hypothetical protein
MQQAQAATEADAASVLLCCCQARPNSRVQAISAGADALGRHLMLAQPICCSGAAAVIWDVCGRRVASSLGSLVAFTQY